MVRGKPRPISSPRRAGARGHHHPERPICGAVAHDILRLPLIYFSITTFHGPSVWTKNTASSLPSTFAECDALFVRAK
jgi:hypothetical protein